MPGVDGLEATQAIKNLNRQTTTIAVTGQSLESQVQKMQPGTAECINIDIIRGIEKTGDERRIAVKQSLSPIEIGQPLTLIVVG